jgi:ketosteroid isomerase-like protein
VAATATPSDLARAIFAAIDRHDEAAVMSLTHPDARLEMAMATGQLIEGREAVVEILKLAWERDHRLQIDELVPLDDHSVIIVGRSRYPRPNGGFGDSPLVWLCEYKDGMIVRQRLFNSLADAVNAHLHA